VAHFHTIFALLHQSFLERLRGGKLCSLLALSLIVILGEATSRLLLIVLFWSFANLQVLSDFLLLRDAINLVKLLEVRHLLVTVDAVLFVESHAPLLRNFLDLCLPEVALGILDEEAERNEGEEDHSDHDTRLELLLIVSRQIEIEVGGGLREPRVATGAKRDHSLTLTQARHTIAGLWCGFDFGSLLGLRDDFG